MKKRRWGLKRWILGSILVLYLTFYPVHKEMIVGLDGTLGRGDLQAVLILFGCAFIVVFGLIMLATVAQVSIREFDWSDLWDDPKESGKDNPTS